MSGKPKKDPLLAAAVIKVSWQLRGDQATMFKEIYEGVLRDHETRSPFTDGLDHQLHGAVRFRDARVRQPEAFARGRAQSFSGGLRLCGALLARAA